MKEFLESYGFIKKNNNNNKIFQMWQITKILLKFRLITKLLLKKICHQICFQNWLTEGNWSYLHIQPLDRAEIWIYLTKLDIL